ncbi:hypothetical protein J7K50_04035 [bacterium]|nr:hypothetical protein [bacterium]
MEKIVLNAEPRESSGSPEVGRVRKEGILPGNIYGRGIDGSIPLSFQRSEVESIINRVAAMVDADGGNPRDEMEFVIRVGEDEYSARLGELQRDIITRDYSHIEFIVRNG